MKRKVTRLTLTLSGQEEVLTAEGDNKIHSTGLAVSTVITYGNGAISPTAQITVYGLPIETMNKFFRVQWNTMKALLNTVKVEIGNQGEELQEVYSGNITFATINADGAPNLSLVITSQMAVVDRMTYVEPFFLDKGESSDVYEVFRFFAADIGYELEYFAEKRIITDASLNGSSIEKIEQLAKWCDLDLYIEQKSITICEKGADRPLKIAIISPNTGLQGYPSPDQRGVSFLCEYNPLIRFGGVVRIENSLINVANTDWRVYGLISTLETNIPQGKWQMAVNATWRDSKYAAVQR